MAATLPHQLAQDTAPQGLQGRVLPIVAAPAVAEKLQYAFERHQVFKETLEGCGITGIKLLRVDRPDSIEETLEDVMLVDADLSLTGFETARETDVSLYKTVRRISRARVLLTTFGDKEQFFSSLDLAQCEAWGDAFLRKPFCLGALSSMLRGLVVQRMPAEEQKREEVRQALQREWLEKRGSDFRHQFQNFCSVLRILYGAVIQKQISREASEEVFNKVLDLAKKRFGLSPDQVKTHASEFEDLMADHYLNHCGDMKALPLSKTLLLIDDQADSMGWKILLSKILEPYGYTVKADDGQDISTISQKLIQSVDVVLLDINLHEKYSSHTNDNKQGIVFLREIQKKFPGLPVVIFTAFDSVRLAEQCKEEGAVEYYVKEEQEQSPRNSGRYYQELITKIETAYNKLPRIGYEKYIKHIDTCAKSETQKLQRITYYVHLAITNQPTNTKFALMAIGLALEHLLTSKSVKELDNAIRLLSGEKLKTYGFILKQLRNLAAHSALPEEYLRPIDADVAILLFLEFCCQHLGCAFPSSLPDEVERSLRHLTYWCAQEIDRLREGSRPQSEDGLQKVIEAIHKVLQRIGSGKNPSKSDIAKLQQGGEAIFYRVYQRLLGNSSTPSAGQQNDYNKIRAKIREKVMQGRTYKTEYQFFGTCFEAFFKKGSADALQLWRMKPCCFSKQDVAILSMVTTAVVTWYFDVFLKKFSETLQ